MKSRIIDVILVMVVILLLPIGGLLIRAQVPADDFSPPNVGVGRVLECVESALPCVETINYESSTETVETEAMPETEAIFDEPEASTESIETEEFVEDIDVLHTEELIEVIPAIEGKYLDVPMSAELQDYVRQVSADYGIPFELTMAVIYVESTFNPWAKSPTGDYGLMQVYYGVWNELGVDLKNDTIQYDPEFNVLIGCGILKEKIELSGGDFTTALIRYNIGDSDAQELFRQGIYSTEYSESVLAKYYEYIREG